MKRLAVSLLVLGPALVFAKDETFAGTKKDMIVPQSTASSGSLGVMPLIQMLAALAIVFVLIKYLLPKLAAKFGKRINTKMDGGIRVQESASFAGGMLYIIEARDRTLLVAAGSQGVTCLADLTGSNKPVEDDQPVFTEILADQPSTDSSDFKASVDVQEDEDPAPRANAQEALETLRRFSG